MKTIKWFETPTQVAFYDIEAEKFCGGIAYRSKIICGCCGGVFDIEELYDYAKECEYEGPVIMELNWEDISEAIVIGGDIATI